VVAEHVNRVPEERARARANSGTGRGSNGKHTSTRSTPDDKVLAILKESTRPLAVAASGSASAAASRRSRSGGILERNAPKVSVTDERPATYRIR